jgi:hypothetical protein
MRRRDLVLLLGGVAAIPRALRAQQKAMPVIGFLSSASPGLSAPLVAALREGLSETGYVEGQNLAIEYRWAEFRYDRLPALAADFVARKVEVIATNGDPVRHWQRKTPPRQSQLSSALSATRSRLGWSAVSLGRAATSLASAPCKPS